MSLLTSCVIVTMLPFIGFQFLVAFYIVDISCAGCKIQPKCYRIFAALVFSLLHEMNRNTDSIKIYILIMLFDSTKIAFRSALQSA